MPPRARPESQGASSIDQFFYDSGWTRSRPARTTSISACERPPIFDTNPGEPRSIRK